VPLSPYLYSIIQLPNNCRRGKFKVLPDNWKISKAKLTDDWYAQCRFIDPWFLKEYPKRRVVRIRAGINRIKIIEERKVVLAHLIGERSAVMYLLMGSLQTIWIIKSMQRS